MKTIARQFIPLLMLVVLTGAAYPVYGNIKFFTSDKVSRDYHGALLRSPSISNLYLYSTDTKRHYMAFDFGAKIPAISKRSESLNFDIGGAGGIFTRFELFSESFNFVHADFTGMLFSDVKYKNVLFETSVYHNSSHIGDDYIKYHHGSVKNTGWEAVRQYVSYVSKFFIISLGAEYKFSRRPQRTIFYPLSFFVGGRMDLLEAGIPFFLELEVEAIAGAYAPNIGVRAGIYLKYIFNTLIAKNSPDGSEPHELSIYYYNGYSPMGYFYNRRETLILAGPIYRY